MFAITGATGHVGNNVVRELLAREKDARIRALVLPNEDTTSLRGLPIEMVKGNILDMESLLQTSEDAHVAFHIAGAISLIPGDHDKVMRINVDGTKNVIAACKKSGVKRLVYTSSNEALKKPSSSIDPKTIEIDPEGGSCGAYGKSKAHASLEVLKAVNDGSLDAVLVCPTGVMGPNDFLPSLFGKSLKEWATSKVHIHFGGSYDFVDVRDVALGHILAYEKGKSGEIYLLSSGQETSIPDILEMVDEIMGKQSVRIQIPLVLMRFIAFLITFYSHWKKIPARVTNNAIDILYEKSILSNEKTIRDLGYAPRPTKESFRDTIEWLQKAGKIR